MRIPTNVLPTKTMSGVMIAAAALAALPAMGSRHQPRRLFKPEETAGQREAALREAQERRERRKQRRARS